MRRRCRGSHRLLIVDDITPIGAAVTCVECEKSFHLYEPEIEEGYTPFVHNSPKGPEGDKTLLILDTLLDGV